MHSNQTVEYVTNKKEEWGKFDHFEGGIMEVLERMNDIIDESDPDVMSFYDEPQWAVV